MKETEFAALLCSKLCHDLISPVSAISNGIEILEDEQNADMREQVLLLIKQSAEQTSSSVQFYRAAFGSAGGLSEKVELETIKDIISNFTYSKKINTNWHSDYSELNKKEVRLLLNFVLLASESLVRGGDMDISLLKSEKGTSMSVEVKGESVILYPPVKTMFEGAADKEAVEPRTAPISLIFSLAGELKAQVSIQEISSNSLLFIGNWPANI